MYSLCHWFRLRRLLVLGAAPLLAAAMLSAAAMAGPVFHWVCDDAACNGDPGFSFSIEFADGVVAPNASFTGVAGNVVAATLTSGVGAGFTLTLADLIEFGSANVMDRTNFSVAFDATGTQVRDLLDASAGTNLTFAANGISPRADIFEGTNFGYSIGSLNDGSGFASITIAGRLVLDAADTAIPEGGGLALFALAVAGLALRRRRPASITAFPSQAS